MPWVFYQNDALASACVWSCAIRGGSGGAEELAAAAAGFCRPGESVFHAHTRLQSVAAWGMRTAAGQLNDTPQSSVSQDGHLDIFEMEVNRCSICHLHKCQCTASVCCPSCLLSPL